MLSFQGRLPQLLTPSPPVAMMAVRSAPPLLPTMASPSNTPTYNGQSTQRPQYLEEQRLVPHINIPSTHRLSGGGVRSPVVAEPDPVPSSWPVGAPKEGGAGASYTSALGPPARQDPKVTYSEVYDILRHKRHTWSWSIENFLSSKKSDAMNPAVAKLPGIKEALSKVQHARGREQVRSIQSSATQKQN